ncbi:CPBP family intramembrane metalloprotease [candidate division WOR-3 bacterium]|nr:CPBP family intramembrane metalloprotease [candidate division WOR-3 bacterium]
MTALGFSRVRSFTLRSVFLGLGVLLIIKAGRYECLLGSGSFDYRMVPTGLAISFLLLAPGVAMTSLSLRNGIRTLLDCARILHKYYTCPMIFAKYILIGLYEELFWRGTVQSLLGRPSLAIPLSSLLFTLIHLFLRQETSLMQLLEFFIFSIFMGWAFYWTGSLLFVATIHAGRNANLAYLQAIHSPYNAMTRKVRNGARQIQ